MSSPASRPSRRAGSEKSPLSSSSSYSSPSFPPPIIRDISRDVRPAPLGSPEHLSWLHILQGVTSAKGGRPSLRIDLLDMVVIQGGQAVEYLASDGKSGELQKKNRSLTPSSILTTFLAIGRPAQQPLPSDFVAALLLEDGSSHLVTLTEWNSYTISKTFPPNAILAVPYIPPTFSLPTAPTAWGNPGGPHTSYSGVAGSQQPDPHTPYGDYRHDYKLDASSHPQERHLLCNVGGDLNGLTTHRAATLPSSNKPMNDGMSNTVRRLVAKIEEIHKSRVTEMRALFVKAPDGKPLLLWTTKCCIQAEPGATESGAGATAAKQKKRLKAKAARLDLSVDAADAIRTVEEATLEDLQSDAKGKGKGKGGESKMPGGAGAPHPLVIPLDHQNVGLRVDYRIDRRRLLHDPNPDEEAVSRILQTDYKDTLNLFADSPVRVAKGGRRTGTPQGTASPLAPLFAARPSSSASDSGRVMSPAAGARGEAPLRLLSPSAGAHFSPEHHAANSEQLTASSNAKQAAVKSRRVRDALQHSSSAAALLGSSQMEHVCKGDFCSYDLELNSKKSVDLMQPDEAYSSAMAKKVQVSELRSKLLDQEREAAFETLGMIKRERGGVGSLSSVEALETEHFFDLPFSAVVQARKEKNLVDLLLRRHKKGEKNIDYISYQDVDGFDLSEAFPGVYYQPCKVCKNCFGVYNFVEASRNRSVKKLKDAAVERKKALKRGMEARDGALKGTASLFPSSLVDSDVDSDDNAASATASRQALLANPFLDSEGSRILARAQDALECITKADVTELRGFKNPPNAVKMIVAAIIILLRGKNLSWESSLPIIANGERFFNEILDFDPEDITDKQIRDLEPYTRNPSFRPDEVSAVSNVTAKFCAWVIGASNAYKCRRGLTHERVDVLATDRWFAANRRPAAAVLEQMLLSPDSRKAPTDALVAPMPSMQAAMGEVEAKLSSAPQRHWSDFEKDKMARKERKKKLASKNSVQESTRIGFGRGGDAVESFDSSLKQQRALLYNSNSDDSDDQEGLSFVSKPSSAVHQKRARVAAQRRRMEELSSEGGKKAGGITNERKTLLCADGVTRIPYEVMGKSEIEITKINFVVFQDIFDSCDNTKMLFLNVTKKHQGCQILLFNYPGQAGTTFPNSSGITNMLPPESDQTDPALNNDFLADRIHELLCHVDATGEFISSAQPFHIVGIGNGLPIALAFAEKYHELDNYRDTVRSIVSINGFSHVDSQLASVLHSSLSVFKAFPTNRPDLPVSYFTRFLFSDGYLANVPRNLALNLYTAVMNPITLEGRIRLAAGALKHRDMREVSKKVKLPLIAIQATENMLVNASNVDALLEGRNASHVWSHQLRMDLPENKNCYDMNALESLLGALNRKRGAMVVFVRSGHALAQESKRSLTDLFDVLACPTPKYTGVAVPTVEEFVSLTPGADFVKSSQKSPAKKEKRNAAEEKKSDTAVPLNYRPGEFLDDPEDARALEEESMMRLAEKSPNSKVKSEDDSTSALPPPSYSTHFNALQKELMEQIDRETKQMVADAALVGAEEGYGAEVAGIDNAYTVKGMPDGSYESEEVKQDEYDRQLQAKQQEIFQQAIASQQKSSKKNPLADKSPSSSSASDEYPSIPAVPANTYSTATDSHSVTTAMKPVNGGSSKEPSTRFYHQDIRGGEKELVILPEQPLATSMEPAFSLYGPGGARDYTAPNQVKGDVARPFQLPVTIPSLDIDGASAAGAGDQTYAALFGGENAKSINPAALELLNRGIPINAIPPELLVAPPSFDQKAWRTWSDDPNNPSVSLPSADDTLRLDAELQKAYQQERDERERRRIKEEADSKKMIDEIQRKQDERRRAYEAEDAARLAKLEMENLQRQAKRAQEEMQRRYEIQEAEAKLVKKGLIEKAQMPEGVPPPIREMPPVFLVEQKPIPAAYMKQHDLDHVLDDLEDDAAAARKMGVLRIEEFDKIKARMAQAQLDRDMQLNTMKADEQKELFNQMAQRIQTCSRGKLGRKRSKAVRLQIELRRKQQAAATKIQAIARGMISRHRVSNLRQQEVMQLILGGCALSIQRVYRGFRGREVYQAKRREIATYLLQRVARGMLGRKAARKERERLLAMKARVDASIKIQSTWKMKVAREEYRVLRVHLMASIEIQRVFRGRMGRKRAARVRKWETAEPGAERLKMGLQLIEESKLAFERQQEEIDALHRAQAKAEARVSHIHNELKDSEQELGILEKELQDIDQIERDLQELTHERQLLQMNIAGAVGIAKTGEYNPENSNDYGGNGSGGGGGGGSGKRSPTPGANGTSLGVLANQQALSDAAQRAENRARQAESHALEMAIHVKRAEREKKKNELESEFALVFSEVERKKAALERLEIALADMEATRQRKDREFGRLQRNLMELLQEQKYELDNLREKGIELETATATSAAAAAATAHKAREHEKQTSVMYNQQEELMKFQFMSMSLSYFSSLNMLKQMRDMNADTTSAAISSSADTAAAAAAAAAAANLPAIKQLKLGATDNVDAVIAMKQTELKNMKQKESDAEQATKEPFPSEVRLWTVKEVGRWLNTLSLGMYAHCFEEACVDGEFLLELREEDMAGVLGIKHALHRRKIIICREKLMPLSRQEIGKKAAVESETKSDSKRVQDTIPELATVFSQARHGRIKRVEESLLLGFNVNSEDEAGNTLLLIGTQNGHKKLVEMLMARNANINHQNTAGNTALHYALAYDTTGVLAEFLIERGADDTLENKMGLSPYDGLGDAFAA